MKITDDKTLTAAKEQLVRYKFSLETHNPVYWEQKGFGPKTINGIYSGLKLDYEELKALIEIYEQSKN